MKIGACLLVIAVILPFATAQDEGMFRGNSNHTAFSELFGDLGERMIEWSFLSGDGVWSSPVVGDINGDGDKNIVFGSEDGFVYALLSNFEA